MLVKAIHIIERKATGLFEIYTEQKDYYFRVAKKLEQDVKVGMMSRFSKAQLLYITEIVTDCEDESQYTSKIRNVEVLPSEKIVYITPSDRQKRVEKRERQAKNREIRWQKKLAYEEELKKKVDVYEGSLLTMKNKKFEKTKQIVQIRANKVINSWIKKGDIVLITHRNKKGNMVNRYLLIEAIVENFQNSPELMERKPITKYYKKTKKGYVKRSLNDEGYAIPPKKKEVQITARNTKIVEQVAKEVGLKQPSKHPFKVTRRDLED